MTRKLALVAGVLISSLTAGSLLAQTAAGLDELSDGRALLGLGYRVVHIEQPGTLDDDRPGARDRGGRARPNAARTSRPTDIPRRRRQVATKRIRKAASQMLARRRCSNWFRPCPAR